jgi:hypothetical protein
MSSETCCYTPGLKRKTATTVRRIRRLPILGEVLVSLGDKVEADTIVARTYIPGAVQVVNIAGPLGIDIWETSKYVSKKVGDEVNKGEPVATLKDFFGLIKRYAFAPCSGTVEIVSDVTGQMLIRESQTPLEVDAYIPGEVVEVMPKEGAIIETPAAFIQGIFGIGGERKGELMVVSKSPDDILTDKQLGQECKGKILVGGARITYEALQKAIQIGVKGIVVGGISDHDLTRFLGYKIGVAITGQEDIQTTLIVTEGFGEMSMSAKTFSLFKDFSGKHASINGATQIRAGVLRPEIVVPRADVSEKELSCFDDAVVYEKGLLPGAQVRIIREPYFGALGVVSGLPVQHQTIETESDVRVLEVELADGRKVVVPRANVEIIEE